jgi:hypothetical protein
MAQARSLLLNNDRSDLGMAKSAHGKTSANRREARSPVHASEFSVRNAAARWHSGGNLILLGCELPPDGNHNGQGESNPPVITRPASDPVNRESITVGNRIRKQIEILAIEPDVPFLRISEFYKPLANDNLSTFLFCHGINPIALSR